MPKAAIDEDCYFLGGEYDIDFDAASLEFNVAVFSESEARAVQHASEGDLGLGVRAPVGHHRAASCLVGSGRGGWNGGG